MKLLADMNISPRTVTLLRAAGHEVVRVSDVLDPSALDTAVIAEADRTGAAIVSQDQDFSALLAASGATRPSLVNLRLSVVDAKTIAKIVDAVVTDASDELEAGAIVTIDDGGVRVRRLPVG